MIDLVFTICLIANPADCSDQVLTLAAESQPQAACVAAAPIVIEEVQSLHPELSVTRWRCDAVRTAQDTAQTVPQALTN